MNASRLFLISCLLVCCGWSAFPVHAQLFRGSEAPGVLAHKRLLAEPALIGYNQPVRIMAPSSGEIAFRGQGMESQPVAELILLGMQVGPVYQLRVSAVLRGQNHVVYPTIELLDRLYPPPGLALHHPVRLVITQDDIEQASAGRMVTKVVYLEDPLTALPYRQTAGFQATLDVGSGQDPLHVADRLGRPMALVRLGSRRPLNHANHEFHRVPLLLSGPARPQPNGTPSSDTQVRQVSRQLTVCDDYPTPVDVGQNPCPPVAGCTELCPPVYQCSPDEIAALPKPRRDEYICDGNDRNLPVGVNQDWEIRGLDIEDTIAHFDTLAGNVVVVPSNRVCIYAPRFAAIRRLLQTNLETVTQKLNTFSKETPVTESSTSDFSSTTVQNVQLQSNRKTQKPAAFRERTRGVVADNTIRLAGTRHAFKPFENLQLVRFGKYSSAESARLALAMQSAAVWESDLRAQIAIDRKQPVVVNDVKQVQEVVSIDSETNPAFRLCKLASAIDAEPGELVDFTIRFDNIGQELIGNVTIIDELSPRLEFVEGSAECSVDARFTSVLNDAGSRTLRWEIVNPLEAREGGLIRFQCRVR